MRYLLDTNIIIFILTQKDDDISEDVRAILDDFYNTFYISSLSIVELIFLFNNGKIKSTYKNVDSLLQAIKNDLYIQTLHTKDEHFKITVLWFLLKITRIKSIIASYLKRFARRCRS